MREPNAQGREECHPGYDGLSHLTLLQDIRGVPETASYPPETKKPPAAGCELQALVTTSSTSKSALVNMAVSNVRLGYCRRNLWINSVRLFEFRSKKRIT